MDETLYNEFLVYHVLGIVLMLSMIVKNYHATLAIKDDFQYYKSIKRFTPALHGFNAVNIYVGATMSGFYHIFDYLTIIMIIASVLIIILEAKRYKFMKNNLKDMDSVREYAIKKYRLEIAIIIVVYIFAKLMLP